MSKNNGNKNNNNSLFKGNSKISDSYNAYYEGGKESEYNKRFATHKIPVNELGILNETFEEVSNQKSKQLEKENVSKLENYEKFTVPRFKILDYGCGDGRYFSFFEEIAEKLGFQGKELEVISYDISKVGLEEYQKKLKKEGFEKD